MQLILVRHGLPARKDFELPVGPPLSKIGLEQARIVASRIHAEAPEVLVSSQLLRARQTADASAALLQMEIQTEPGIAEVDGEGVPYVFVEDIRAQGGEAWAQFLHDPVGAMGADDATFRTRVRAGFSRIIEKYGHHNKVAVFTHGFPINLMTGDTVRSDLMTRLTPDYCSISRFVVHTPKKIQLLSFNETGHFQKGPTPCTPA